MKKITKILILTLTIAMFSGVTLSVKAQGPPPPPPNGHALTGDQQANGAPIGTAVGLMLGLFAAYGAKKAWDLRKKLGE